jgi:Flp pilus assembly protein TadB
MNWGVLLAASAALGTGSLTVWIAQTTRSILQRFLRFRASPIEGLSELELSEEAFAEEDLYGLRGISWEMWQITGALLGAALAYLLLAERNAYLAIVGLGGAFVPRLVRSFLVRRRRGHVDRQIRDFIFLLRPAIGMRGGLHPALEDVCRRLAPGVVRARLMVHLDRSFSTDPVDVIEALGDDVRSPEMERLLLGIRAARKGGMSYAEAIVMAAEEAKERMLEEAKLAIEETPVRLLIPMLILLLPPILVLLLHPLVARLLALMAMPGTGTLAW